ncbi:MAG: 30S ribosomal protein S2 [Candidatus Parcubacteria bacterium]|nr:MAG: 30S ribosomal protein S2 [Candidatus Parcubacteria bacterium]
METQIQQQVQERIFGEMMKAGVHYGRAKRYTHPSIKNFLLKSNKNIEFFNLRLTLQKLNEVSDYLKQALAENKKILFVGTTPASQNKIQEIAQALNQYYLNYKWVGGFLTNFQTIKARLIYFRELLKKEESGEIQNLPPAQRVKIEKELQKLKNLYSGVVNLDSLPDIVFIVNLAYKQHKTAKREAIRMKIPIIALAGSDNDVSNVFLFVPGNDKAPRSIAWQLDYLLSKVKTQNIQN